jgi:electron transfer flavoprotein beta subunit
MKILVPFKRVRSVDASQWLINPFDEIALEEALRIRERGEAAEVVGVTIGPPAADEQVRAALAMGLDRAIRVDDDRLLDPYAVARILKAVVQRESPRLVFMGKQAVDDDANQVGQMLAGVLNWPQSTFVSKVELMNGGEQARCTRETDRGLELMLVQLPAVITADLRLNEPRYVSLPGLMKARRRPIEVVTRELLQVNVTPRTTLLATLPAPRRPSGVKVDSLEELLRRLREQEGVL